MKTQSARSKERETGPAVFFIGDAILDGLVAAGGVAGAGAGGSAGGGGLRRALCRVGQWRVPGRRNGAGSSGAGGGLSFRALDRRRSRRTGRTKSPRVPTRGRGATGSGGGAGRRPVGGLGGDTDLARVSRRQQCGGRVFRCPPRPAAGLWRVRSPCYSMVRRSLGPDRHPIWKRFLRGAAALRTWRWDGFKLT